MKSFLGPFRVQLLNTPSELQTMYYQLWLSGETFCWEDVKVMYNKIMFYAEWSVRLQVKTDIKFIFPPFKQRWVCGNDEAVLKRDEKPII